MLTQAEADHLLGVRKWFPDGVTVVFTPGESVAYELESDEPAERFVLDTYRGRIKLSKVSMQNRARTAIVLARLDLNGAPHTNPDGEEIDCPHLHVYREGYEDKWAAPLDPTRFRDPSDLGTVFADFCRVCSIANLPELQESFL